MSLSVKGRVTLRNGTATSQLVSTTATHRPDASPRPLIAEGIRVGRIVIRPTIQPFTRDAVNSVLMTVERKFRLEAGVNGEWLAEADEAL